MKIFDAHCDTIYEISRTGSELYENSFNIDLKRMAGYGGYTQFFAAWIENEENAWENFYHMADIFDSEIEKNSSVIKKCIRCKDLTYAEKEKKIAAFLTLEGAYMIRDAADTDKLFDRGVRCIALTWNGANKLAGGVDSEQGLTRLGYEVIERMEELGMLVDVSHLNERSFWDVAKASEKPIIASHSNSYEICRHKRNLTDEQFTAVCKSGGCVGINFYSKFLAGSGKASLDHIAAHIKHFLDIGGEDHIGLGTDFDGVDSLVSGVDGVQDMKAVTDTLEAAGLSFDLIDKITYLNFERVLKAVIS